MQGLYTTVPNGFLLCNGQEVAIASFPELYAVIGTLEGCQSENEGMFKVPDLRGRFLEGADGNLGNRIEAGLPNIEGTVLGGNHTLNVGYGEYEGAFYNPELKYGMSTAGTVGSNWNGSLGIQASRCSPIYGNSKTVQPPAVCVNYIIKY